MGSDWPCLKRAIRDITTLMTKARVRCAWLGIAGVQVQLPAKVAAKVRSPTTDMQVSCVIDGSPAA